MKFILQQTHIDYRSKFQRNNKARAIKRKP